MTSLSIPSSSILSESDEGSQEIYAAISFFHSKARKFFGNTLRRVISRRLAGVGWKTPRDMDNGIDINKSLFWYSKVSGSGNFIVVDIQYRLPNCSLVNGCGFALVPLVNDDETTLKLSVFEGTPRKLLYLPLGMITYDSIDAYLPKMNSNLYVTIKKSISQTLNLSNFSIENKICSVDDENLVGLNGHVELNGNLRSKLSDDKYSCTIMLNRVRLTWSQRIDYDNTLLNAIDKEYCGEAESLNKCRKSSFLGNMRQKRLSLSSKSQIMCRYLRIIAHDTDAPLFTTSVELEIQNDELIPYVDIIQLPRFSGADIAYVFSLEYQIALPKGKYVSRDHKDFHIAGQIYLPFSLNDNEGLKSISLVQNREIYTMFDSVKKFPFESTYMGGSIGFLYLNFNVSSDTDGEFTELQATKSLGDCIFERNDINPDSVSNLKNLSSSPKTSNYHPSRIDIDVDDQSVSSNSSHRLKSQNYLLLKGDQEEEQNDTSHSVSYGRLLIDTVPNLKCLVRDMQMYIESGDPKWLDSASSKCPRDKCLSILSRMEAYTGRFKNEMIESMVVRAIREEQKTQLIATMMKKV